MKKITCMLVLCLLAAPCVCVASGQEVSTDSLGLSAKYAVLIDAATMQVLYAKDCDAQAPIASTTKIMTALLLLEAGEPELSFTVTDQMVRVEGTSMGLRAGDTVSRYALACGMLLSSGNDAAQAAAIHLAGSLPAFADLMNRRAEEIGMTRTHFVTPSGLDADEHYSTAYDMAVLGREAMQNPVFREICSQTAIRAAYGNPPYPRTLSNHNRLVREVAGCVGVKTGFTKAAGRCLVSAVEREGRMLIGVTLHAPNDWEDHRKLYDYGFAQYHSIALDDKSKTILCMPVAGGLTQYAEIILAAPPVAEVRVMPFLIRREILAKPFEYAPLPAGKIVGTAKYYSGDALLCEVPLVVREAVPMARPAWSLKKVSLWDKIRELFHKR